MKNMYSGINYLGLSTEDKPDKAFDGETFLEVDTSKVFIFYDGNWYEL